MRDSDNWQDDLIHVDDSITLHSIHECYVDEIFALVQKNKAWLRMAMDWPQYVLSVEDSRKMAQGNYLLHHRGYAKMFLIFQQQKMVGVISFNQIEPTNKVAYIGYWLDKDAQGQGIISRALQAVVEKYSREGMVRRFVIKCIVSNTASNQVALRNGFTLEGCLKQAEFLNGVFYDQNIYGRIVEQGDSLSRSAQYTP
ncbi:ribosomal protein L7p-serine acetyltransferase [Buttiauxella ferragutiae ATCC 51602]|uniref:Ribosomal protein L7p-serine acetyltransferase n=1 Tax=Buttiauxella ferragutiae ATCC 51602 TaxID=1354252 RepID=A0ABX2W532_9ENTR|nr:50S ribosomal protein L7/L12-serine acetyltransferase [Buttiauxella ferragutiae]OAT25801.1 ribosomal protein L7p-serine acetyltransferase [Buttiauxella ferragutiae ATCC 51602]